MSYIGHYMIGRVDGKPYLVFESEYEASKAYDAEPHLYTGFACFNGFENALSLAHTTLTHKE